MRRPRKDSQPQAKERHQEHIFLHDLEKESTSDILIMDIWPQNSETVNFSCSLSDSPRKPIPPQSGQRPGQGALPVEAVFSSAEGGYWPLPHRWLQEPGSCPQFKALSVRGSPHPLHGRPKGPQFRSWEGICFNHLRDLLSVSHIHSQGHAAEWTLDAWAPSYFCHQMKAY